MRAGFPALLLAATLGQALPASESLTLRSLGAKGDGRTDDRAAIQAALTQNPGRTVDGEGLTYAVDGTIDVRVPVVLRNLTLRQIADTFDTAKYIRSAQTTSEPQVTPPDALLRMVDGVPFLHHSGIATYGEDPIVTGPDRQAIQRMLTVRTLFISGTEQKPVSVKLEKVKVLRGPHADAGMHSNAAGIFIVQARPAHLTGIEITGSGKGAGLLMHRCHDVRLDGLHIHDLLWAPYLGDVHFPAAVLGADFGWNNSPIYDFQERTGRFIRVRVQEQLTGFTLSACENVEVRASRVERIGTVIDGKFVPWQADGATLSAVKNLVMRDCVFSQVWEGIDFTGRGVDGFLQENIRISDTFAYGFKYAHPQRNGKVVNCVSERAGFKGFTIGSESHNIEFINCAALETGAHSAWRREGRPINGIAGFDLSFDADLSPKKITLRDCRAENTAFPAAMEFGFRTSDRARNPDLGIRLLNPKTTNATVRAVDGFAVE